MIPITLLAGKEGLPFPCLLAIQIPEINCRRIARLSRLQGTWRRQAQACFMVIFLSHGWSFPFRFKDVSASILAELLVIGEHKCWAAMIKQVVSYMYSVECQDIAWARPSKTFQYLRMCPSTGWKSEIQFAFIDKYWKANLFLQV